MPRPYSTEAIEECQRLYLRFNGQHHDRIERQMRRTWPGWSKQNLYTRGAGANKKIGWIEKYGWEKSLKLHLASRPEGTLTSAEKVFNEIEEIRKKIYEQIKTVGPTDRDLIYQHRDYSKLSIDALNKITGAGHTFENFVAMWERLLDWLPDIDDRAATALLKVADQVIEKASAEYGKQETNSSGSAGQ